jgi:alpha-mannosidase
LEAPRGAGATPPDPASRRIYIAADDHTDYMWSADEETYRQALVEMIDYYLDLTDSTKGNPSEYQSRWNCDGSFWLWTYQPKSGS